MKKFIAGILVLCMVILVFPVKSKAIVYKYQQTIASSTARVYAIRKDGTLLYWGKGTQNDHNGDQSQMRNGPVELLDDVIGIYANWWSGFAVKSDNTLWAVGNCVDNNGKDKEDTDPPVKIMDNVKEVACGYSEWIVLKTDGTVWKWGYYTNRLPKKVMTNAKQISAGIDSFYAVRNDETLWGWGNNYSGQLGVKTGNVFMYSPIKIMDNVSSVCGAGLNAYVIKTDGSLWGWGANSDGLIYTGQNKEWAFNPYSDGSQSKVIALFDPVKLMDDVIKVSERNNIAIIKRDNTLWVWGNNESGELGDGTTSSSNLPTKLLNDAIDVTCNSANTIVLKKDGTLWGCGSNACGELGLGSFDNNPHVTLINIMHNIALPNSVYHRPSSWARADIKEAIKLGLVPEQLQCF